MQDTIRIRSLQTIGESEIRALSDVLIDCVEGGSSVSFMFPMSRAKAEAFWRGASASIARGERVVLVAEDARGTIVGTIQVLLNQPENQPHRGDVAKMLVHRRFRRCGIGAALLAAAEQSALGAGKTLLVLDTASSDAERLYAAHGWERCGRIPNYALFPDGRPCATTVFFKSLSEQAGSTNEESTSPGSFDLIGTYVRLRDDGGASRVNVPPTFWQEVMAGKRRELDDGRLVAVFQFETDWTTAEMHPGGDEIVYVLTGAIDLILAAQSGDRTIQLGAGAGHLIPRGVWHTARVRAPAKVLHVTPGTGTQHRPL
jgi:GNAT superfamily N-acetyltransferase/mannose-6-phosphate isomerase-like protein (cupin superfamily)